MTQKKINIKYNVIIFGIVFLFGACKVYKYTNVIEDIMDTKNEKALLVRDVKNGESRIYILRGNTNMAYKSNLLKYLRLGDTVEIATSNLYKEHYYPNVRVFYDGDDVRLMYSKDSVNMRKQSEKINLKKQEINNLQQEKLEQKSR